MNLDIIKNDIFLLSDAFFEEILNTIDNNYAFIDDNKLLQTKHNYFFLFDFLNTTITHFLNLENSFANKTVKKLHKDVKNLYLLYQYYKKESSNIEQVFKKNIFSKIPLFQAMEQELNYIKKPTNIDEEEMKLLIEMQYKEMHKIYFTTFKDEYQDQLQYILESLKIIINTKLYYLDSMLWNHVNVSSLLKRTFKNVDKNTAITAKIYIQHRLAIDLPYTADYKYLQDCLRTYK